MQSCAGDLLPSASSTRLHLSDDRVSCGDVAPGIYGRHFPAAGSFCRAMIDTFDEPRRYTAGEVRRAGFTRHADGASRRGEERFEIECSSATKWSLPPRRHFAGRRHCGPGLGFRLPAGAAPLPPPGSAGGCRKSARQRTIRLLKYSA